MEIREGPPLTVFAVGVEGLILSDGAHLYMVWPSKSKDYRWVGMPVDEPRSAFPLTEYASFCGAEFDMRQSDDDPMTPEVMELGDRAAKTLSAYFTEQEKSSTKQWEAMQKATKQNETL